MQDFLLDLHDACHQWRLLHLSAVPVIERDDWVARYFEILAAGYAAQPPPPASSAGSRKGRRKQSQAKNLLDALLGHLSSYYAMIKEGGNTSDAAIGKPGMLSENSSRINVPE